MKRLVLPLMMLWCCGSAVADTSRELYIRVQLEERLAQRAMQAASVCYQISAPRSEDSLLSNSQPSKDALPTPAPLEYTGDYYLGIFQCTSQSTATIDSRPPELEAGLSQKLVSEMTAAIEKAQRMPVGSFLDDSDVLVSILLRAQYHYAQEQRSDGLQTVALHARNLYERQRGLLQGDARLVREYRGRAKKASDRKFAKYYGQYRQQMLSRLYILMHPNERDYSSNDPEFVNVELTQKSLGWAKSVWMALL